MKKQDFLNAFHHAETVSYEADFPLPKPGRPAAVLIPMIEREDQLSVLLTQRAMHLKHHAGQISFPGGKQEPDDDTLLDTALRETEEEIGISAAKIEIIGQLPSYRTISYFEVRPFIGLVEPSYELILDTNEVAEAFEVPLAFLMDQSNHLIHQVKRKGQSHPIYFIPWQDKIIWGATAAFIRNLSNHVNR